MAESVSPSRPMARCSRQVTITERAHSGMSDVVSGFLVIASQGLASGSLRSPSARTGKLFAAAGADGNVLLWDARSHEHVGEPLRGSGGYLMSVAFSPDGSKVVAGDALVGRRRSGT